MTLRNLFGLFVLCLLFFAVVMPNSFQLLTGLLLSMAAVLALPLIRWNGTLTRVALLWLVSAVVTAFYVMIGVSRGAPLVALQQILIIYIGSPLLWLIVSAGIMSSFDYKIIDRWTLRLTFLALASVAAFFYLYMVFGSGAVEIFKRNANVYIAEGNATATIFVYGSLMYLLGGLFAAPGLVKGKWWAFLLFGGGLAAVLTSGRHALFLSAALGFALGIALRQRGMVKKANKHTRPLFSKERVAMVFVTGAASFVAAAVLEHYGVISVGVIRDSFIEKLSEGGGEVRIEQALALLDGALHNYGLGAGHGIGVDYVRDYKYPWRYENVWMATFFRVGLVGSFIYVAPFIYYFLTVFRLYKARSLDDRDVFVFVGFLVAFLNSATNPYIEAFSFQWMYVFPVVYGCYRWSQELAQRRSSPA